MKLIRPLKLTSESLVYTTAAPDEYPVWEPVGRDFATDLGQVIVTAAGDDLYVIKDNGPADPSSIRCYSLSTGLRKTVPITALDVKPVQAAVSPNGQWLAIVGKAGSDYGIRVFNTQTGALVYQRVGFAYSNPGGRLLDWAANSSFVVFSSIVSVSDPDPVAVAALSSTWGIEVMSARASAILKDPSLPSFQAYAFVVCALGSSAFAFTGVGNHVDMNYPPAFYLERCALGRVDIATGTTSTVIVSERTNVFDRLQYLGNLAYNPYKNHILANVEPGLCAYHATTLASQSEVPPGFSNLRVSQIWVSPDSDELVIQNPAVAPYIRRFVASTYATKGDLAVVGSTVRWLSYGSNYYACGVPRPGFVLIDRSNDSLVQEVSPSVQRGDIYTYNDAVYEALQDNQDRPDLGAVASPPTWLRLGVVNRLRMFDGQIESYTEAVEDLDFTIVAASPELVEGIAMLNILGRAVRVQLVDGDQVVYDSGDVSLIDNVDIDDWYRYFYEPFSYRSDYVFTALPPCRGATVRVRITNADGIARLGEIVLGRVWRIGDLQYGVGIGIQDFSRKERDEFGRFVVVERQFSKWADYPIEIRTNRIASIQRMLGEIRATPAVFIGAESQPETIVYGFYRSFDIVLSRPVFSECNIEVEGLT